VVKFETGIAGWTLMQFLMRMAIIWSYQCPIVKNYLSMLFGCTTDSVWNPTIRQFD